MLPNWNNAKNISKKPQNQKTCNYRGKNQETASQNFSSCAHQLTCSNQIQLLILLSCPLLLAQILIH